MLLAGGSLSCCIDPHRGRNMCAMHRSMGRLKMRVRLPDDWGKLCRWHWQHSEGHADLRRSPRGEARPLVALMGGCLITCPPETLDSLPGTHLLSRAMSAGGGYPVLGLFWGQGAGVSPTTVPQGSVTEGCSTCERGGWFSCANPPSPAGETKAGSWERSTLAGRGDVHREQTDLGAMWFVPQGEPITS